MVFRSPGDEHDREQADRDAEPRQSGRPVAGQHAERHRYSSGQHRRDGGDDVHRRDGHQAVHQHDADHAGDAAEDSEQHGVSIELAWKQRQQRGHQDAAHRVAVEQDRNGRTLPRRDATDEIADTVGNGREHGEGDGHPGRLPTGGH